MYSRFIHVACFFLTVVLSASSARASITTWHYTNENGVAVLLDYLGRATNVIVPDNIGGLTVVGLDDDVFAGNTVITNVRVANTVTNIGSGAFSDCSSLASVWMSNGVVNIDSFAFSGCRRLKSVTLSTGIQSLAQYAFSGATNLSVITLPAGLTNIGNSAFAGCTRLSGVTLPAALVNIGVYAFDGCGSLTSVSLPASLKSLGSAAFNDCTGLTNIVIPRAVTAIGSGAFKHCSKLRGISVNALNDKFAAAGGVLFNKTGTLLIQFPGGLGGSYSVPSGVTGIIANAFSGCSKLTGVSFPKSLRGIGGWAFSESGLLSITTPATLTALGDGAFYGCPALTNAVIGAGLTELPSSLFYGCAKLRQVSIPSGVVSVGAYCFDSCGLLGRVTLPAGVDYVGDYAFEYCTNMNAVYFMGNRPSLVLPDAFLDDTRAVIYYLSGTTGWGGNVGGRTPVQLPPFTLQLDPDSLSVPEGGSATFDVRMTIPPPGEMTLQVTNSLGDGSISVSAGKTLTFTPANWSAWKTVTLAAAEDNGDNANGVAFIQLSGTGFTNTSVGAMEADDDYTLNVVSPYGQVTVVPDQALYDAGTSVNLSVEPFSTILFEGWAGGLSGSERSATVVMDRNTTVRALYAPIKPAALPPKSAARRRFTARWAWVEGGAPEGELRVASDAAFTAPVAGYDGVYVANLTELAVTNLAANRDYWYQVRRLLPNGTPSAWSVAKKARTGRGAPAFKHLLSPCATSKGATQRFALSELAEGVGTLAARSSDPGAVAVTLTTNTLALQYLWEGTARTARVTMVLRQPDTGYRISYRTVIERTTGRPEIVSSSALTNAGAGLVAQELTVENRTDGLLHGLRIRVLGLDRNRWCVSRTGVDPESGGVLVDIPCLLAASSQLVVRVVYEGDYAAQAQSRPVAYRAFAIMAPLNLAMPVEETVPFVRQDRYDGLFLLTLPATRNRLYSVQHTDNGGGLWVTHEPLLRATANSLMFLDEDEAAPLGRRYRVVDEGL